MNTRARVHAAAPRARTVDRRRALRVKRLDWDPEHPGEFKCLNEEEAPTAKFESGDATLRDAETPRDRCLRQSGRLPRVAELATNSSINRRRLVVHCTLPRAAIEHLRAAAG